MLILSQIKDIPVLEGALPIFEEILARKKLLQVVPKNNEMPTQARTHIRADATHFSNTHRAIEADRFSQMNPNDGGASERQQRRFEADVSFNFDFLEFDFLHDWQGG